jgi:hypothetical protein
MEAAGGILGSGGQMVSGIINDRARADAYNTQKKGLAKQKQFLKDNFNPEKLAELSLKYDKGYLQRRLDLQKEYDPELAEVRQLGKEQLLQQIQKDPSSLQTTKVANQLFKEGIEEKPASAAIRDRFLSEANKELDLGANLPPEYQAELVRAGLTGGSQAGIKADKRTIGGTVSRLLGGAGIQLQQQRQNQAMNLAGTADQLAQSRQNILSNIFPSVAANEADAARRAGAAFGIGEATMPEGGLTGREVLGLDISQKQGELGLVQQRYDLSAQNKLARGRAMGNIIGSAAGGSIGNALSPGSFQMTDPITGNPMGGGGGDGGGGKGGGGGWMSSIMGLIGMFSDASVKENFHPVEAGDVLRKLNQLPVQSWSYVFEPGVNHIGPMAQDFNRLFGVGESRTISTVDAFGVLIAAVKALTKEVESLKSQMKGK